MLVLLLEAATRSLALGILVWLSIQIFRIRNPHTELTLWTAVLLGASAMPLAMQWSAVTLPETFAAPGIGMISALEMVTKGNGVNWILVSVIIYACVAGLFILRLLTGLALTWRMQRAATMVREPWTQELDVRVSATLTAPVVFASSILIPTNYTEWKDGKRAAVLAHEHSHISRGDFYVQALAELHCAVFWFSPLSWWLRHRVSVLAEEASDAAAVSRVGSEISYAEILLEIASQSRPVAAAVQMARSGQIEARIERILSKKAVPLPPSLRKRAFVAASLIPLLAVAACDVDQAAQPIADPLRGAEEKVVTPRMDPQNPVAQPPYPTISRQLGEEGQVILKLSLDKDGDVVDATVDKSSGFERLDLAALEEAKTSWRLLPGTINGEPAPMTYNFSVTFLIKNHTDQ